MRAQHGKPAFTFYIGMSSLRHARDIDTAKTLGHPILVSMAAFVRKGRIDVNVHSEHFQGRAWGAALDSGGFWAARTGGYKFSVEDHVEFIVQTTIMSAWSGPWDWWAAMDYCVEPEIAATRKMVLARVEKTAESLEETHTILNYWREDEGTSWVPNPMPVLQGWHPADYELSLQRTLEVLNRAGEGLPNLVGIGSVCRRHMEGPEGLWAVVEHLDAILPPTTRVHLFGIKGTALPTLLANFPHRIASADSQAWSMAARYAARGKRRTAEHTTRHLVAWVQNLDEKILPALRR